MKPILPLLTALVIALPSPCAQAQDLDGNAISDLLKKLEQLETSIVDNSEQLQGTAMQRYIQAAGSEKAAVAFFLQCIEELQFTRNGAGSSEFRDWKKHNEGRLDSKEYVACLRLQLQYLVLTLKASQASGEGRGSVIAELHQFLQTMLAGLPALAEEIEEEKEKINKQVKIPERRKPGPAQNALDLLRKPITDTAFAQAYDLDTLFKDLEDWELAPLEVASIFEKAIVPYYAKFEPEQLDGAWSNRILYEHKLVEALSGEAAAEKFSTIRRPQLRWDGAMWKFKNTNQQSGAMEMLAILSDYPKHPSSVRWIADFRTAMIEAINATEAEPAAPVLNDSEGNPLPKLEVVPTE